MLCARRNAIRRKHLDLALSDVLALFVRPGSRYPSVNQTGADGFRGGRKSDAYKKLFTDVETAARSEIERTGWATAMTECALTVVRYIPDRRRTDAAISQRWSAML